MRTLRLLTVVALMAVLALTACDQAVNDVTSPDKAAGTPSDPFAPPTSERYTSLFIHQLTAAGIRSDWENVEFGSNLMADNSLRAYPTSFANGGYISIREASGGTAGLTHGTIRVEVQANGVHLFEGCLGFILDGLASDVTYIVESCLPAWYGDLYNVDNGYTTFQIDSEDDGSYPVLTKRKFVSAAEINPQVPVKMTIVGPSPGCPDRHTNWLDGGTDDDEEGDEGTGG